MAAVTPYEPLDYQQFSVFRPYQLPVNDIFKAVSAQSQYWDEGAYRVKSVYENALNLSLSKDANKKIRDQFVKDSEQQLAKLSTMNLADASVQRMGINIYKPLLEDRGIISDHAATEHIRKINSDAERARTQDHGKYYNQSNHQYALHGVKEFMDSADRNAGEAYLKQARNYEDFYDYTSEYKKAIDLCPEDSESSTSPIPNTGYFLTVNVKERSASKAYNCLLSALSPKAIRQLQIEGSVVYRNTPIKDFAQEVLDSYSDQINLYDKKRQQISASLASINSKDNKMSNDQKRQAFETYTKELEKINENISEITVKKDKLIKGDVTDIYENFDSHAGNLYAQKKLYKQAVSSAIREFSREYSANPVELQRFRQTFEAHQNDLDRSLRWRIHEDNKNFQIKMKQAELILSKPWASSIYTLDSNGNVVLNPNQQFLDQKYFNKPDVLDGNIVHKQIVDEMIGANKLKEDAHKLLFNNMVTKAANNPTFRKTFLEAYGYKENELEKFTNDVKATGLKIGGVDFKNTTFMAGTPGDKNKPGYIAMNPNEDLVVAFTTADGQAETNLVAAQTRLQLNEKTVRDRLGIENMDQYIGNELTKKGYNQNLKLGSYEFTPAEVFKMARGETVVKGADRYNITLYETPNNQGAPGFNYNVSKNGKLIGQGGGLSNMIALDDYNQFSLKALEIKESMSDLEEKIKKVRGEVYKQSEWENKRYIKTYDNESPVIQSIQSKLSTNGKADKNIAVHGFVGDGEIVISVPGGNDNTAETLATMGMGSVENLGNGYYSIKNTGYGMINQPINNPYIRSVGNSIAGLTATKQFELAEPGSVVQTLNIPIWINGNHSKGTLSVIKMGENDARFDLYRTDPTFRTDFPLIQSPNALSFINQYSELLAPSVGY